MKILLTQPVEIALRTMGEEGRRNMLAWIDHLKNWDTDPDLRQRTHKLDLPGDVYVLRAGTDFRIFFSPRGDQIEVLDIARKDTIMMFRQFAGQSRP